MDKHMVAHRWIEAIQSQLTKASVAEIAEQQTMALAAARELALKCVQANANDPDCWFMAGLAMYESFAVGKVYGEQTEKYLQKSLDLDNKHQFARLYLGHYYYDIGHYKHALEQFGAIEPAYFLSADKKWRILKLHELILSSKLRLNYSDVSIDSFRSLIEELNCSLPEDIPIPLEMAITLAETRGQAIWQRIDRGEAISLFTNFVEKQSYKEVLRDYIAAF